MGQIFEYNGMSIEAVKSRDIIFRKRIEKLDKRIEQYEATKDWDTYNSALYRREAYLQAYFYGKKNVDEFLIALIKKQFIQ